MDKWARMLTSNILEFTRIIWNERCTIVAAERDASYDGRKRKQLWILCSYLKRNTHLLPPHKTHVIQKEEHYFQRQPLDNILMWKRHLDVILDPHHTTPKTTIKHHFKCTTTKSTPKPKKDPKQPPKKKTKKTKTKIKIQSTLLPRLPHSPPPSLVFEEPPPISQTIQIAGIRRSERLRNRTLPPPTIQLPRKQQKSSKPKTNPVENPKPKPISKVTPSSKFKSYQDHLTKYFSSLPKTPSHPKKDSISSHSTPTAPQPEPSAQNLPPQQVIPAASSPPLSSSHSKRRNAYPAQHHPNPSLCHPTTQGFKRRHNTSPRNLVIENSVKKPRVHSPSSSQDISPDRA